MIHDMDVGIFHLMARLKLCKERREGKFVLTSRDNGGVFPSFDHLVKFVPREEARVVRNVKRRSNFLS